MVKHNDVDGVQKALDKVADVNTQDKNKHSLLLLATINKQVEMAMLLAEKGANVNLQDSVRSCARYVITNLYSIE